MKSVSIGRTYGSAGGQPGNSPDPSSSPVSAILVYENIGA
jgi:hypothetical protein